MMQIAGSYPKIKDDIIIYPAVIWIIAYEFLERTNFTFNWNGIYGLPLSIERVCRIIVLFFAIYNVVKEEDIGRKILYSFLIVLGWFTSVMLLVLWVSLAGRSMKTWLSVGVGTVITMFAITIASSCMGIIGMGRHGTWEGNFFGMATQGQISFVLLFLMMGAAVLRGGRFAYYEYVAMYLIIFFNTYVYRRRNANICMTVLVTMLVVRHIYLRCVKKEGIGRFIKCVQKCFFDYCFILAYAVFMICVFLRDYIRILQPRLPWLRTFLIRLDDTAEIWRAFPLTLFGNYIHEYAGGNATSLLFDPLFSRTLLYDGLAVFTVLMIVTTYFMVKARQREEGVIYIAFMVMALFSISDPVAWDVGLNFLIALPFAEWDIPTRKDRSLPAL